MNAAVDLNAQVDYVSGAGELRTTGNLNAKGTSRVQKRPLTPAYVFFFILFWPDTWRIVLGVAAALILTPLLLPSEQSLFGVGMFHVMIACIGYAVSASAARAITRGFKRILLKGSTNRVP